MHVGIHVQILVAHGVEHAQRLLRRRRIIQIHQRLALHLARQNRKILPYLVDVVHVFFLNFAAKVQKKVISDK